MAQVEDDGYADFDPADEVVEHFYVGRGEACQDKAWLNANNIKRIVNAADDIPNFFDRDKTFSYQNLNLSDTMSTNQLVKAFQAAGKFAVPALKAKINVLVHCSRHSARSVAVAMAVIMQLNSVSLMEANLLILSKRPEAKIRRHLQLGLMTFERKILGTSSMNVDDFSPRGSDRGKRDQHFSKKAVAPDNGGWKVATRERDGKKYYWHEATRQTSWVKPAGFVGEDMSVSMSMSMSITSRSRESSSDSDSDESDSTESLEYSDEGGGGFSPNMNQKTLRNEQEHIHRDRTTSMQLLDVKEENESLRSRLEVKEQETQILRAELVSLRQDMDVSVRSQKHLQAQVEEHKKTIARLRERLAALKSMSEGEESPPPPPPSARGATASANGGKALAQRLMMMSPIKPIADAAAKNTSRRDNINRDSSNRDISNRDISNRDISNRDISNRDSSNRELSKIDTSRHTAVAAVKKTSRRLFNSPVRFKARVTKTQWRMQNDLGRSEKDYIDKLSSVVKILLRVRLSESKNHALQKKLHEELRTAHIKLYEDLRPMKQTKTQARFLDTLSGAFETHFLPLRKKYMEYALALDGAQNCCKEVGEAGPSLKRQRMEKLRELMHAPIDQVTNYCTMFDTLQAEFASSPENERKPAIFRFMQLASTLNTMRMLMQQMVLKGQKMTLSVNVPALQSLRPRFELQDLILSGSMCTPVRRLIGGPKLVAGHLYLFERMLMQLIKTNKGLEVTLYPMLPSVKYVPSKDTESFGLETRTRYRLFSRKHPKYGQWQGRIINLTQPSGRKETVEVQWWSHLNDSNLWMEQITTCLDSKKMDEQLSEMLMASVASNNINLVSQLIEASSKAKTLKIQRRNSMKRGASVKQAFAVVNMRNAKGHTPLMVAALEGHSEMVQLLMEYRADLSFIDSNGDTALHFAASKGLLEHLVIMSHDPNFLRELVRENIEGFSPLNKLAQQGSGELFFVFFQRLLTAAATEAEQRKIREHFNAVAKRSDLKPPPQFGRKLEEYLTQEVAGYEAPLPSLLILLRDLWVGAKGPNTEGIFRIAPRVELSKQVKDMINCTMFGRREELALEDRHLRDPHIFSRLLKHFLGDMNPGILLPSDFMNGASLRPVDEALAAMTPPRRAVLMFCLDFLIRTIMNTEVTKMTPKNIGIVLGPNLAKFPDSDATSIVFENKMLSLFLQNALEYRMKERGIAMPT